MWERFLLIWPSVSLMGIAVAIYWGSNRWIGLKRPFMLMLYYTIALAFEALAFYILLKQGAFNE